MCILLSPHSQRQVSDCLSTLFYFSRTEETQLEVYMLFYMDEDYIDIGDIFRAPISQRNNTPGRSMLIRELKLKQAPVKIHEIVLCAGPQREGFWVTVAQGGL